VDCSDVDSDEVCELYPHDVVLASEVVDDSEDLLGIWDEVDESVTVGTSELVETFEVIEDSEQVVDASEEVVEALDDIVSEEVVVASEDGVEVS
jgi:hypothetical protein